MSRRRMSSASRNANGRGLELEKSKERMEKKEDGGDGKQKKGCFAFRGWCASPRPHAESSASGSVAKCGATVFLSLLNLGFPANHLFVFPFESQIVAFLVCFDGLLLFGSKILWIVCNAHQPISAFQIPKPNLQMMPAETPQLLWFISSSATSNVETAPSTPYISEELKVASQLRKFSFAELKSATKGFKSEYILGQGGFGCVYKCWVNEIEGTSNEAWLRDPCCSEDSHQDGLQGHKEWLMKIAYGAAKGLAFLHEEAERPVIYRDFKASNVLLDVDYNAKLSDFGLAKDGPEGDKTHVSTRVMGTYGYAAPEYVMTDSDVDMNEDAIIVLWERTLMILFWSGFLEMLTGRRSMDKTRPHGEHNLVEWARPYLSDRHRFYHLIDPRLEGRFSMKAARKAAELAAGCLRRDPKARPLMSEVVERLRPLPHLKDMACESPYFHVIPGRPVNGNRMQAGSSSRGRRHSLQSAPPRASPSNHPGPHQSPKPRNGS
nr:probable serine/threonine-protein kinase PIX7 [Ipomoea batatas]